MSIVRATALIASFSILSKLLGLVKFMVLGNQLGAGQELDIYVAAFRIPDLIFNLLILGTLSVAFIPVFVRYVGQDRDTAMRIASTIFNLTLLVMGVFASLGFVFAPLLMRFVVPGFDHEAREATVLLTRVLMLSPLLFSLSSILTSILHSFKKFLLAAIAPLFYNLSIIFGVLVLYPKIGLPGLAWGAVLGAFLHLSLQLPMTLKMGFRPLQSLDLRNRGVRKIGALFLPRLLALDLGQISFLIATIIGSTLAVGTLASFYFAYELMTVPLGIFAMSFSIAAFPSLAGFIGKSDLSGFRKFFSTTVVQILFLIIPISVLMLLLRAQIVRLIPGAGEGTAFTFEHTRLTAQALGFFALSLFSQSLTPLLARAFFALQNTLIPLVAGTAAAGINIVLAVVFSRYDGAASLALAFSIASVVNLLILGILLQQRVQGILDEILFVRVFKIGIASMVMGAVSYLTLYAVAPMVNMQTYWGILIQAASAVLVGGLVYVGAGIVINLPESRHLVQILRDWFSKFTKPVVSAVVDLFTDIQ